MCIISLLFSLLFSTHFLASSSDDQISVDLETAVFVVSDQFLSVVVGANSVRDRKWTRLNFTAPRMIHLAQGLKPAMLRVGGSSEDFLVFQKNQLNFQIDFPPTDKFSMTTEDWDAINQFTQLAGWDFIFGLNVLLRQPDGNWDSSNAEDLFAYTMSKGYTVNWELGNEPNEFPKHLNLTLTPEQLAADFGSLVQLLSDLKMKVEYIAGPDVTRGGVVKHRFLHDFLSAVKPGVLQAVTWHHYYEDGRTAKQSDMYSVELLDSFTEMARVARSNVTKFLPGVELWLGETSSCYGGGSPVLSGSYVSGFMWLDKLGIAARMNHSRVFRQSYISGHYALLDKSFNPLPDYWLSVLYKRLVGERVLGVKGGLDSGRHVRVYSHCAKQPTYPAGDVVLLVLNTHTYDTSATLMDSALAGASRDVYWLTPPDSATNVLSTEVALNGKLLSLVNNSTLPDLPPLQQMPTNTIKLPALSFGYYVFKNVRAKACM